MTERLAEIGARIGGMRQLGAVVNAMRGIAGARAQQARQQLRAVDAHTGIIATAIGRALALAAAPRDDVQAASAPGALVVFCAEQGFAGAFSQRVLDQSGKFAGATLFLVGTRGLATASERGITPAWHAAMPSHAAGIPKLADAIAAALYARIARHGAFPIDVLTTDWQPGAAPAIVHHRLLPVDLAAFPRPAERGAPLVNLPPALLLADLTGEYLHARLCHAALHAFAAENEARMAAMAAACTQIDRQLGALQARQRMVRQEEITAEIIELAAGQTASRRGGTEPSA